MFSLISTTEKCTTQEIWNLKKYLVIYMNIILKNKHTTSKRDSKLDSQFGFLITEDSLNLKSWNLTQRSVFLK